MTDKGFNSTIGARVYGVRANAMEENFIKRYGTLSFTAPELDLEAFIQVEQGMRTFIEEEFDWLLYGSSNPFINNGARLIKDWTKTQQEKGWTSTAPDEASPAAMYGKIGYVMLGNETTGADFITPVTRTIINDSILMLRFDALAFVDESGNKDANKLNVTIKGGGEFIDGTLSKTIDLAYYDPNGEYVDDDEEKTIWKTQGRTHILYIVDTETNPRTQQTRIVFSTGNFTAPGPVNRVFMDKSTFTHLTRALTI